MRLWSDEIDELRAEARAMVGRAAALWDELGESVAADQARNNMASMAKAEGVLGEGERVRSRWRRLARGCAERIRRSRPISMLSV